MPKPLKFQPIHPASLERESMRITLMNAAQDMLFSMEALGETKIGVQMEIGGVMQSLACFRMTAEQFELFSKEDLTAHSASRASGTTSGPIN